MSDDRRTDIASRPIAASPAAVYRALLDPSALMAWLPPAGMSGRVLLFEPWEGGRFRIELRYDSAAPPGGRGKTGARSDISAGRFLALEPGRRVVQSVAFQSEDPFYAGEMTMTWSLAPAPGGTLVTIVADNVPAGISAVDHEAGLASSLQNLADFLAA
jgi:uncharacterized protein YndB with AHSA1/START domain